MGSFGVQANLEFGQHFGNILHRDLAMATIQYLDEATHVRALELVGKVHGQVDGGHGVLAFVVLV